MIRKEDRVAAVLERDPALIDVFASMSPAFERLRNPGMRRVMARLVTVEQAARIAGVDADRLVARLNEAIGETGASGGGTGVEVRGREAEGGESGPVAPIAGLVDGATTDAAPGTESVAAESPVGTEEEPPHYGELPADLGRIPAEAVVLADVREDLRAGREPFSRIMAARRQVPPGGCLVVRAVFEPVPLYAVMDRQGFTHYTEKLADDDWRVWFYQAESVARDTKSDPGSGLDSVPAASRSQPRTGSASAALPAHEAHGARAGSPAPPGPVVELDVRGLEPPEPMLRTLEALESVPPEATLVQINVRVPQFLLPELERRGFAYEIHEVSPDLVRIHIRRATAARG